jgi:hypothetical protein
VEVSDWLTKIVVGLGLINLKQAPGYLKTAASVLQPCFGDCYLPFGIALILGFSPLGFLFGNVFTRLFLARAFKDADLEKVRQELKGTEERLQQAQVEQSKQLLKTVAQAKAERAMEDPLLSEKGKTGLENTQIETAAKFVQEQPEQTRSAMDWMILAYQSFRKGNYKSASDSAEKALLANPPQEMRWKIHNLLGLCYHWQQPPGWQPGGDRSWFEKSKEHYLAAIANRNSLAEELLAKSNLAFLYLDASLYADCEKTASEVLAKEPVGGVQITSICDLARIATAASEISRNDTVGAQDMLNKTKDITAFDYLFNPEDLSIEAIRGMAQLPNLRPEIKTFLSNVLQRLTTPQT